MTAVSILDLSPIPEGGDATLALGNSVDLAQHAERWGYRRYWIAEHHNMPGIASAATAVVIGHIANATSTIRVGAGGIMLPNHAPLVVAEQFGTLAALFPGRIDLGLGRAPGTDQRTSHALRRNLDGDVDAFPRDVAELQHYFRAAEPGQRVRAVPGAGLDVPIWILGSSLFGAQLAAALGLPFGFASHFAPASLMPALEIYRTRFQPSAQLAEPYVMVGFNVFAAATQDEARLLQSSAQQAILSLRRGRPCPLPPPVAGFEETLLPAERKMLDQVQACSAVGTPVVVREGVEAFVSRTGADEVIITGHIFDHAALALPIVGAIKASQGDYYRYPVVGLPPG
jgi:luciferase family oxidoreductase group 1